MLFFQHLQKSLATLVLDDSFSLRFVMLLEEKSLTFAIISMLELQLEARNMLSRSFTLFHLAFSLLNRAGLLSL